LHFFHLIIAKSPMTNTALAPADSIFAVMSPQSDRSTTPPVRPNLRMMIDRTS
jgi:hypothetical protein